MDFELLKHIAVEVRPVDLMLLGSRHFLSIDDKGNLYLKVLNLFPPVSLFRRQIMRSSIFVLYLDGGVASSEVEICVYKLICLLITRLIDLQLYI